MKSFKLLIVFMLLGVQSCKPQSTKINGVSFEASNTPISKKHIAPVLHIHANYAAIMPFGYIKEVTNPNLVFNTEKQWYGETKAGAKQYIQELQSYNIKIMLKPQIWVWRGEFTGFIEMQNETDWKTFENAYSKFILAYAQQAQDMGVDIFCIGTELERFITNRPHYWENLIQNIKKIYKGKLTYAANWDEYKRTPFWKHLDYIGIDAYFPVSDSKTPLIEECLERLKSYKLEVYNLSKQHNKSILFTEFGYRSVDFSGKAPWKSDRTMDVVNLNAQTNTTKALFDSFWDEEWFAGGFVWKWHHNHASAGGLNNSRFTPQNKPAEHIIRTQYKVK